MASGSFDAKGATTVKKSFMGFEPGDRVRMIACEDQIAPIEPGTEGTIIAIDDAGTLHMRWDNGRTLGVCLEEDHIEKIKDSTK